MPQGILFVAQPRQRVAETLMRFRAVRLDRERRFIMFAGRRVLGIGEEHAGQVRVDERGVRIDRERALVYRSRRRAIAVLHEKRSEGR